MNMRGLPAIQYYVTGGQINDIYESLFEREADPGGLAYYESLLKDASVADAIAIIGGGARGEDVQEVTPQEIATKSIVAAYEDALGRPGQDIDVGGLQFYQDQVLNQGLDATLIDNILASSPEAQARFGEDVAKKQEEAAAFSNLPGQDFTINPDTGLPFVGGVDPNAPTTPDKPTKPVTTSSEGAPVVETPAARTLQGLPRYTLQQPSALRFAPFRRGSTQLQGPTSLMAGEATSQTSAFEQQPAIFTRGATVNDLYQQLLNRGPDPEGYNYWLDEFGPTVEPNEVSRFIGGIENPTERAAAELAAQDFLSRLPQSTLLQDFALQTGAYGAPTPTSMTIQPPAPVAPLKGTTPPPGTVDTTPIDDGGGAKEGGMIRMAEGGEAMAKLSPAELGSEFDRSAFVDEEGRLVGGYSTPVRDEYGVITGYNYRPYERDVVFGETLRGKEAGIQISDADQERILRDLMIMRGQTGVGPSRGGLAGIEVRGPVQRNRPLYYPFESNYAKGGDVAATAQDLASRGRGGDTMLVHMAPHEVAGLNALARAQGDELTINPETGMPEALKLGKLFKQLAPIIPFIPGVGQFLAPIVGPGLAAWGAANPILAKAVASGVIGGFTGPKGGFDLQRGLMQGITAYGLGSLQQNLAGAPTPGGPANVTSVSPEMGGVDVGATGIESMGAETAGFGGAPPAGGEGLQLTTTDFMGGPSDLSTPTFDSGSMRSVSQNLPYGTKGIPGLDPSVAPPPAPSGFGEPMKTPTALITTGLGISSIAESDKLASAQMAARREKEEEEDIYRRLFERTLGRVRTAKQGGLMKLAGGGMTYMEAGGTTGVTGEPRDVTGTGDGMSDSVPASIEGVQEARLADGEFVIPADVVADIGNGSSDAGSKKLYDMMDRVRKARHGTTEQPPEIKAERLMPA